jgi:hypothetical protein
MKKIEQMINKLRESKRVPSPVSFSFHCLVGNILNNNDDQINSTMQNPKILQDPKLIHLIP